MDSIGSFADMFDCSADELQMLLFDEDEVKRHAFLCYQVGRIVMPCAEPLSDEEIVLFFKFLVKEAIKEKRKLEKR